MILSVELSARRSLRLIQPPVMNVQDKIRSTTVVVYLFLLLPNCRQSCIHSHRKGEFRRMTLGVNLSLTQMLHLQIYPYWQTLLPADPNAPGHVLLFHQRQGPLHLSEILPPRSPLCERQKWRSK